MSVFVQPVDKGEDRIISIRCAWKASYEVDAQIFPWTLRKGKGLLGIRLFLGLSPLQR